MTRYLSFRFDDGYLAGARTADALLAPDRASFFVISGLIERSHDLSSVEQFVGPEFGTLEDWRVLAAQGHDVQPHSVTHPRMPNLAPEAQADEATRSLDLVRRIHDGPYVFCHPYNLLTDLDFAALGYAAAGFASRGSARPPVYNDLAALDPFRLRGWAVFEPHFDRIVAGLADAVPENSWTVLAFHSLDGEGFKPWSSARFAALLAEVRRLGYRIETVGGMIRRLAA